MVRTLYAMRQAHGSAEFDFLPTTFVLIVSVLREGIEDYARYKSDKLSNK